MMMTGIKLNIFSLLRTFIHSNMKQKKFYPLGGRINTLEQENNADNIGLIILTPPKNSKYLYKLVENGVDNKIKLY